MGGKVKPPLFTLRGHNVGVTSLAHCVISSNPYLISGDEEGSLVIWDLSIFRVFIKYSKVVFSRIQSLKVIRLYIDTESCNILVVQSRDNGILLLDLNHSLQQTASTPRILGSFPTVECLFSRGDAMNIGDSQAILAYPSCIEDHLVTIRILGEDAKTQLSGTAQRNADATVRNCKVFDIKIKKRTSGEHLLFVAYEDGCLSIFSFSPTITKTVPVLNSKGLKVVLVNNINLNISDFISAYDIVRDDKFDIIAVCGSPLNKLTIISGSLEPNADTVAKEVALKRPGTSVIAIRPDCKLFAAASWDTTVRLYSMKSFVHLANINNHSKQVQSLLFIERPDSDLCSNDNSQLNSNDNEGKYLLCCASMEGTISVSAIY